MTKPKLFAMAVPDWGQDLAARLLREEAAECLRRRNLDFRRRDQAEERAGRLPMIPGLTGGASALQSVQAAATDRRILQALATGPKVVREIADASGLPRRTVTGAMQRIKLAGRATVVKTKGVMAMHGVIHRYYITDKGRAFIAEAPNSPAQRVDEGLAIQAAPEAKRPPAAKFAGFCPRGFVHPQSNEARIARVSLAPWPKGEAAE